MAEKEYEKELDQLKKTVGDDSGDLKSKVDDLKKGIEELNSNKFQDLIDSVNKADKKEDTETTTDAKAAGSEDTGESAGSDEKPTEEEKKPKAEEKAVEEKAVLQTDKTDYSSLQNSIRHLDTAIQNLIKIFSNATNELKQESGEEEKLKKVIEQNEKILSKLDELKERKGKEKDSGEEKPETNVEHRSPFMPKPNVPGYDNGLRKNPAPKPPEDDSDIPYLKPRKSKKYGIQK